MRHYEVTIIIDPVLSASDIQSTFESYLESLKEAGSEIVHIDEMGLRQLAYPIKKRNSGIYYCIEFGHITGDFIDRFELALRRDERIMRFLTTKLDQFGVKYNQDKRDGKIGAWRKEAAAAEANAEKATEKAEATAKATKKED